MTEQDAERLARWAALLRLARQVRALGDGPGRDGHRFRAGMGYQLACDLLTLADEAVDDGADAKPFATP